MSDSTSTVSTFNLNGSLTCRLLQNEIRRGLGYAIACRGGIQRAATFGNRSAHCSFRATRSFRLLILIPLTTELQTS